MTDTDRENHTVTANQPEDAVTENPQTVRQAEAAAQAAPASSAPPPGRRFPWAGVITAVVAVAGILLVLYAWKLPPFSTAEQRTENAYVRGRVTVISPQVNGYVTAVLVQDFQRVKAGDPLFRIDDRIYRQRLEQAQAALAAREAELSDLSQKGAARQAALTARQAEIGSAEAQLARAQADMARVADLAADGSVSLRERDQAQATLRAAQAAVNQTRAAAEIARQDIRSVPVTRQGLEAAVEGARAAVRLAEIDLANTVVAAPEAGQVGQVGARLGQYVTAGTQLVSIVPPQSWIIANFKEGQTGRMLIGQRASVSVDALGDRRFTGRVQEISPATGSEFAVLPAQNATGNFTKVAQRLPVRIVLDANQAGLERLRPGMSVVARVDTASRAEAADRRAR